MSAIISIAILLFILKGFEWKKLGKAIGKMDFSVPTGSLPIQVMTILSRIFIYIANFCLQLTIACFRQAFRIFGIKIK